MKNIILLLAFVTLGAGAATQPKKDRAFASLSIDQLQHLGNALIASPATQHAEVYMLRNTGLSGALADFPTFLDEQFLGKVPHESYVKYEVPAGEYEFSVQFHGNKRKHPGLRLMVEPGKKYYLLLVIERKLWTNKLYAVEVSEAVAQKLIPRLKPGQ